MTQNANKEKIFFSKKRKKCINKKFGIRINYAQLISFYDKSGLRKIRFFSQKTELLNAFWCGWLLNPGIQH